MTIEAVALTGSDFHDGGGFVADATGGIAVLLADGGVRPRRAAADHRRRSMIGSPSAPCAPIAAAVEASAPPPSPAPIAATTGCGRRGRSRVGWSGSAATVEGSPTTLTTGLAFDVDDGSGADPGRRRHVDRDRSGHMAFRGRRSSSLAWPASATRPDPAPTATASSRAIPATCSASSPLPAASPTPGQPASGADGRHADLRGSRGREQHAAS